MNKFFIILEFAILTMGFWPFERDGGGWGEVGRMLTGLKILVFKVSRFSELKFFRKIWRKKIANSYLRSYRTKALKE